MFYASEEEGSDKTGIGRMKSGLLLVKAGYPQKYVRFGKTYG